jgi:2-polyprenyl-3-methyl-5-hydroxy-6-metoxy-1,4-benzoquinol methylase
LNDAYAKTDPRFADAEDELSYWSEVPLWREPQVMAKILARFGIRQGSLLDVGAGRGRFTEYFAKSGFQCVAIEPNPQYAREIEARAGVPVLKKNLEDIAEDEVPFAPFDVVLMAQVIEHVLNPKVFVRRATALMRPGSVQIVTTPNFESLLIRLLRTREGHICPPIHLNFFTKRALRYLVEQCGFQTAWIRTQSALTWKTAIAGTRKYLGARAVVSWVGGTVVNVIMKGADRAGLGRYLHGYFIRSWE